MPFKSLQIPSYILLYMGWIGVIYPHLPIDQEQKQSMSRYIDPSYHTQPDQHSLEYSKQKVIGPTSYAILTRNTTIIRSPEYREGLHNIKIINACLKSRGTPINAPCSTSHEAGLVAQKKHDHISNLLCCSWARNRCLQSIGKTGHPL